MDCGLLIFNLQPFALRVGGELGGVHALQGAEAAAEVAANLGADVVLEHVRAFG